MDGEQCAKVIACVNHDPKAIASHAANHSGALHFTEDIRTLNLTPIIQRIKACRHENPQALVVLWDSLECTNFSRAKGGQPRDADSRTLAEHLYRYIEAIDPDFIQIENVEEFMSWGPLDKNGRPLSMDKGRDYVRWINNVKVYGYNNDYRSLNAADFGARTTRKRYFGMFAKKGLPFAFPKTLPLTIRLRDVLEHGVDESYYLSDEHVKNILDHCARKINEGCGFKPNFVSPDDICGTITAKYGQRQTDPYLQLFIGEELQTPLNALQGGEIAPTIPAHYYKAGFRDFMPKISPAHVPHLAILEKCEGKILQMPHGYNLGSLCDIAPALTTSKWQDNNFAITGYRIRKLTEREVFRLMGVTDTEIDKINAAEYQHGRKRKQIPKTQKYKMGGNGIVVDVLYHVFKAMFIDEPPKPQPIQCSLFDDFPTT